MGIGFTPTWLRQVSPPLLHKTTLTSDHRRHMKKVEHDKMAIFLQLATR